MLTQVLRETRRRFVTRSIQEIDKTPATSLFQFRLLQWNVLADYLSTTDSFEHVDPQVLQWKNRADNQLNIILEHDYDFVSLQECDHYDDFLLPNLGNKGFRGLFKKKVGSNADGSALLYRADRFELVEKQLFEFGGGNSQVAILALFSPKREKPQPGVCIVTTHLKAKIGFEAFRSKQMNILLKAVQRFNPREWPVVLAMDGNDFPVSEAIDYTVRGRCESDGKEYKNAYVLSSAYDLDAKTGPLSVPYTTFKKRKTEVLRTIDYILFRNGREAALTVTGLQEIPPIDQFPNRLPAIDYPSDHLSIAAQFAVIPKL